MSKRDWFRTAAFVAIPVLILILGGLYGNSKWEEYATERNNASAQHHDDIESRISICRKPEGLISFLSCAYEVSNTGKDDYTSQYDLKAQQDMSLWALGMFITSLATLFVTASGVFFVWLTLRKADETNRAAITAADAGVRANEIMIEERRPWLTLKIIDGSELEFFRGGVRSWISYEVINRGKSPAFCVAVHTHFYRVPSGFDIDLIIDGWRQWSTGKIGVDDHPVIFPDEKIELTPPESSSHRFLKDTGSEVFMATVLTYRTGPSTTSEFGMEVRAFSVFPCDESVIIRQAYRFEEMQRCRVTR
ncbi:MULTISPECIES: hypothetical protein [unclassified Yoonia]|uniref:hypothetical protein n=1 Tax=unclassified Yoonia TaxID=2629118 RepID=UPI002AFEA0E2|nr:MULTISPECIES: hypothetical protein [unclassified Yoonia]